MQSHGIGVKKKSHVSHKPLSLVAEGDEEVGALGHCITKIAPHQKQIKIKYIWYAVPSLLEELLRLCVGV